MKDADTDFETGDYMWYLFSFQSVFVSVLLCCFWSLTAGRTRLFLSQHHLIKTLWSHFKSHFTHLSAISALQSVHYINSSGDKFVLVV